jgi:hypothetical protein
MTASICPFDYRGIFINLDRSTERRTHIEAQPEKRKLRERCTRLPDDRRRPVAQWQIVIALLK